MIIPPPNILDSIYLTFILKIAILIILLFYAIFALIVVKQVRLMGKTLITPVSPIVSAIAIVNAGLSIGFIILAIGLL